MPTLYVENVPEDLYEAIRSRARSRRSSIAAEVVAVLTEVIPTKEELNERRKGLRQILRLRQLKPPGRGPFPAAEEMVREDRRR
ncbi:MAG: hypothetical protein HY235_14445 [Acidobacteria bacterium]|nr:hypothetical protein [Acidobacteriota bacterium]